jgi:hypothetical protein
MTPHEERELERTIDRALQALPPPRAPRSLLPRVLAAVSTAPAAMTPPARPAWSPWSQAAVAVLAAALVTVGYWAWLLADPLSLLLPAPVQDAGRRVEVLASTGADLLRVGGLVWQAVVAPIVKTLFTVTLALCAAGALLAAALGRLALGGAHHS